MIKNNNFNLKLELYIDDGFCFVNCEELNAFGYDGSSFKKAFKELLEIISELKNSYSKVEDKNLTPKGLEFKNKLMKLPELK